MKRLLIIALLVSLASAADTVPTLTLSAAKQCPGNLLQMTAASDGQPVADVELRIVLYEPYQGLVALQHTAADGTASVALKRSGTYRIYILAEGYEYDDYEEFTFTACPPPPPKTMELSISHDCNTSFMLVSVTSGGAPLDGVLVRTQNWSSLTGASGNASFPFGDGDIIVTAEKAGYAASALYESVNCTPPECRSHDDCATDTYCVDGICMNLTGICGYAENHLWVRYACCSDSDCKNVSLRCMNRTCEPIPAPPAPLVNATKNESAPPASPEKPAGCAAAALLAALAAAFPALRLARVTP
ncbi:MAG: hypothetical protein PHV13_02565 [Candidatus ainarchaeum sp.]|nr:hypothetical protein [Candidatus ainarchaeum sp.]